MKRFGLLTVALLFLLLLSPAGAALADTIYVVQPGDTLSEIAAMFGVTVQAIVDANAIGNPNLIYVGQELIIPGVDGEEEDQAPQPTTAPAPAGSTTYVVQTGDTLSRIAYLFGVTIQAIVQANNLPNANFIVTGQELIIPGASGPVVPLPTASATTAPPPPAATPAPPAEGANLFPNPSFENGYWNLYNAPELQVPVGWLMEIDEGSNALAPETGLMFIRPESRIAPRTGLPPAEQSLFLWDGEWTLKVFKGGAPVSFRLFTDVYLQPGTYRFEANYFPDLVANYNPGGKVWATQPLAGEVNFIRSGVGANWTPMTVGVKNTMVQTFTVSSAGAVRLGVGFRTRYVLANNGFFIDDWSLQRVSN
ncbi:MAG: LysM peptidoglycan-binding domain-containing protein [Chloroflexi bacterium]|nr:LysM peptidoglycan-binding domain-containing protein [Chloroflexota bacterium]MCI0576116.1 LysM peptidoglycan-binding domain-containing protein [Chloroflexota bacterium]MCI0647904.1 LysM peptidoglycan-binding domain-containing protein [Chloroflexota bacterium]MCI0727155.1 LysM peptidoglycan-binding domain-containing protein [Chloroflexota bacterium]